jgi:transposase-like protein
MRVSTGRKAKEIFMSGKKRVRHSPGQIVEKLQEADRLLNAGQSLGQVLQALGVSESTYHRWRDQYGGMKASEAKRLKELEAENARLKKLLADAHLDNDILKCALDHLGKGQARRVGGKWSLRCGDPFGRSASVGRVGLWVSRAARSVTPRR